MKRKIYKSILALVAAGMLNSCVENNICIDPGTGGGSNGNVTAAYVHFQAAVEGMNMTRSMSPIAKGIQARIYAFNVLHNNVPVQSGLYVSPTVGQFVGVNDYQMQLAGGQYYFYGISTNNAATPPEFTNDYSAPLVNGVDYLWFDVPQFNVNASQVMVPIVFSHRSVQVVVVLEGGSGVVIDKIVSAYIVAPAQGASMRLSTGVIAPATGYDTGALPEMAIDGLVTQYTMLPVQTDVPMRLLFTLLINGEIKSRGYELDIPLPNSELVSGNSYRFRAVITADDIVFSSVEVKSWVDVDETGKPLYPSQV